EIPVEHARKRAFERIAIAELQLDRSCDAGCVVLAHREAQQQLTQQRMITGKVEREILHEERARLRMEEDGLATGGNSFQLQRLQLAAPSVRWRETGLDREVDVILEARRSEKLGLREGCVTLARKGVVTQHAFDEPAWPPNLPNPRDVLRRKRPARQEHD